MKYVKNALLILCSIALFSGCAPVISKETLDTADRNVRFADTVKNPDLYAGKTIVLGGIIVNVENQEKRTVMEVLQEPLGYQLKPSSPEESQGRFLAVFDGFRDPAVYGKGRPITVAGAVKGAEERTLGKMLYRYPVIEVKEHYLWSRPGYGGEPSIGVGVGLGFTHSY